MKKIFFLFSLILFAQVSWATSLSVNSFFYSDKDFLNCTSQATSESPYPSAYSYTVIDATNKYVSICVYDKSYISGDIEIPEIVTLDSEIYTITKLGSGAFKDCGEVTSVVVPNTVTEFADNVFYGCEKMTSVTLSENLVTINAQCFMGCSSLTVLIIPDSVKYIYGSNCFYGCSSLKLIVFGEGVEQIDTYEFYGCDNLELIVMKGATSPMIYGDGLADTWSEGEEHDTLYGTFQGVPEGCLIIYPTDGDYNDQEGGLTKGWSFIVSHGSVSMTIEAWEELNGINQGTSTGISEVAKSEAVIGVQRGAVLVTTSENSNVAIYSLSGAMVANKNVNGSEKFDLAQGIYIVKVGNVTRKVSVK